MNLALPRIPVTITSLPEHGCDIAEPAPEAAGIEVVEVEVPVELCGSLVDGVDHHGPGAELPPASHAVSEGIDQQVPPKVLTLLASIDRQPTTPFERAMARASLSRTDRRAMQQVMDAVRPGDLYREIQSLTTQLERIALSKAPAPVKPQVNRAFNQ
jgi:hypothetical protein